MGSLHPPERVKLVIGLISNEIGIFSKIIRPLEKAVKNSIDLETEPVDFTQTSYYNEEMGSCLKRKFLIFKKLVSLENIYGIKLKTNMIEKNFQKNGKRTINIDPGYVDLSKLVLFSTKDYTHRIYLKNGIFAEVTLYYKDKTFNPWPWTYPDYKSGYYVDFFNRIRDKYKEELTFLNAH